MYPIQYDADYERQPNRLTTFFRPVVIIPWLIVAVFYLIALSVTLSIAWFAILILGRYPDGLHEFNSGVLRYLIRVNSFGNLVTDRWPPFGLTDGEYPVRVAVAPPPARQSRLKTLFRIILIIPLGIVIYPVSYILQGVALLAWLTIVFRGYQSRWVHSTLTFSNAWLTRASGYHLLLTDAYPPVGDDPLKRSPEAVELEAARQVGVSRPQPSEGGPPLRES